MGIHVLPVRMCVHHPGTVTVEAGREHRILHDWSHKQLWVTI